MRVFNKVVFVLGVLTLCTAAAIPVAAQKSTPKPIRVTPHMEAPIRPDQSIVFCSTFQIAWTDMKTDIIGEDIRLEKPLELVRYLNRSLSTKEDVTDEDYLAMVGYGSDDIADKINKALKEKFGSEAPHVDEKYNSDDVILAYAFLMKELLFENAFEDFTNTIPFYGENNETRVRAFGISKYSDELNRKLRDQVEVIDYVNYRDFIVRLKSKHPDDEIILARVKPERTLLETYQTVNARIARSVPVLLVENDILHIPKFDVSIDHSYSSLLGLFLLNKGFEDYFVAEARQDVRFMLNECGAAVKSEAVFAIKKGPPVDFKVLVFNGPFMLYLKKKGGANPYLAIWVGNAEVLVEGY